MAVVRKAGAKTALPVDLRNIHVAKVTDDTTAKFDYATPEPLARAMKVSLEFILADGQVVSEGEIEIEESEIAGIKVIVGVSQMDDYIRAMLLGHTIDKDGGIIVNKDDVAPKVALLFEIPLSNHKDKKYVTLYNGKFKPNNEEYETATPGEKKYGTESDLEGIFRPRPDGNIKYSLRTDSEAAQASGGKAKIEAWFTAVQEPTLTQPPLAG